LNRYPAYPHSYSCPSWGWCARCRRTEGIEVTAMLRAPRTLGVVCAAVALVLLALAGLAPAPTSAAPDRGPGASVRQADSWSGAFSRNPIAFGDVPVGITASLEVSFTSNGGDAFPIQIVSGTAYPDDSPFNIR